MAKVPNNTNIKKLPPVVKYYTIPSMGYAADTESREKLGHRLNRVIGQLRAALGAGYPLIGVGGVLGVVLT